MAREATNPRQKGGKRNADVKVARLRAEISPLEETVRVATDPKLRAQVEFELQRSKEELERTSVELVRTIFPLEKRGRLLGVSLSNMGVKTEQAQPQLTLGL